MTPRTNHGADFPMVTVTTTLRGASVEEMETAVTKPIEDAVNTVSSIDELRSETREGISQVIVSFKLDKDGDVAAQEVDSKVRTILTQLPVGTDPPIIDNRAPIMRSCPAGATCEVTEMRAEIERGHRDTVRRRPSCSSAASAGRACHRRSGQAAEVREPDGRRRSAVDSREPRIRRTRRSPAIEVVLHRPRRTYEHFNKLIVGNKMANRFALRTSAASKTASKRWH
jgi:hypothetical protein